MDQSINTNVDLFGEGLTDQSLAKEFPGKGGAFLKKERSVFYCLKEQIKKSHEYFHIIRID